MVRRKSFLERVLGGTQLSEQENRNVQAHIQRQAHRKATLDRVSAEREQAKADQGQVQSRLSADLRDQNESLQFHLRRLTDVLRDREPASPTTPDIMAAALRHGGEAAFTRAVQDDLTASPYPPRIPTRTTVLAYRPEARQLVVERELPRNSIIPPEQEYRIFKSGIIPVPHKSADVRHLYGQLLARIALRTAAEAFALTPPELVDSVVLNGRVTTVDDSTGQATHPHLLSVQFDRAPFEELNLDAPELDAELCLRRNTNALISPQPYDLVPVQPVPADDPGRDQATTGTDRESRLDLLTLPLAKFETLVRQLFEARGLRRWHTQTLRDDRIDAVAINEDPRFGGVAVIQAQRYSGVVPAEAVRTLAGAMAVQRATEGILVTTSWFGGDTYEFARRNGRIRIIDGRQLKQLLAETLHLNVLISLPTLPQGGERTQVA